MDAKTDERRSAAKVTQSLVLIKANASTDPTLRRVGTSAQPTRRIGSAHSPTSLTDGLWFAALHRVYANYTRR